MSQEIVEIVRRGFDALKRGDLDEVFAGLHPSVRWEGVPGVEPCRNREEVEANVRANFEAGAQTVLEELIDAGEYVVVRQRVNGAVLEGPYAGREQIYIVLSIRDGKVVLLRDFLDRAEALEAAGLRE